MCHGVTVWLHRMWCRQCVSNRLLVLSLFVAGALRRSTRKVRSLPTLWVEPRSRRTRLSAGLPGERAEGVPSSSALPFSHSVDRVGRGLCTSITNASGPGRPRRRSGSAQRTSSRSTRDLMREHRGGLPARRSQWNLMSVQLGGTLRTGLGQEIPGQNKPYQEKPRTSSNRSIPKLQNGKAGMKATRKEKLQQIQLLPTSKDQPSQHCGDRLVGFQQRWHPGMNVLTYREKRLRNCTARSKLPRPDARRAEIPSRASNGGFHGCAFRNRHVISDRMSASPAM